MGEKYYLYEQPCFYARKIGEKEARQHLRISGISSCPPKIRIATKHGWRKWFPVIDADSVANKELAVAFLKTKHLPHAVIESSPGKFWIIVGKSMPMKKAIQFRSPGNDPDFVMFCEKYSYLGIRGFVRDGFTPKLADYWGDDESLAYFASQILDWFKGVK